MTNIPIHQALFGYTRGHGLLAASCEFDQESNRVLRSASDMSFDGSSRRFLTVLPLPGMKAQAFISTWPAEDWLRAGSVWSHVLLVDFASLGRLESVRVVTSRFRRPLVPTRAAFDEELANYRQTLFASDVSPKRWEINLAFATQAANGIYGAEPDSKVDLVAEHDHIESTLWALYDQQWPSLRRSFAFRTRHRPAESSWHVDLEVTEKGGPSSRPAGRDLPDFLVADLADPSARFRGFLRRYGSQSKLGRGDMGPLAQVFGAVEREDLAEIKRVILNTYPDPPAMSALKRDLLDARIEHMQFGLANERERLALAFDLLGHVDMSGLRLGERLALLQGSERQSLLAGIDLDGLSTNQLRVLVDELLPSTNPRESAALASTNPDLGIVLAARNPAILGIADMWGSLDGELLKTIFTSAPAATQLQVLNELVQSDAQDALTQLTNGSPSIWWAALLNQTPRRAGLTSVVKVAATLRQVLGRIGAGAIGPAPYSLESLEDLVAVMLASDLATGLWRRVPPERWISALADLQAYRRTEAPPRLVSDRLMAVALVASATSTNPELRKQGWEAIFGPLHAALAEESFDPEAWSILSSALPTGPDWDKCFRLRRGASAEIKRDSWPAASVKGLLAASGEFAAEMGRSVQEEAVREQKRGMLERAIDAFLGRR